jgi:hypothetical protein
MDVLLAVQCIHRKIALKNGSSFVRNELLDGDLISKGLPGFAQSSVSPTIWILQE